MRILEFRRVSQLDRMSLFFYSWACTNWINSHFNKVVYLYTYIFFSVVLVCACMYLRFTNLFLFFYHTSHGYANKRINSTKAFLIVNRKKSFIWINLKTTKEFLVSLNAFVCVLERMKLDCNKEAKKNPVDISWISLFMLCILTVQILLLYNLLRFSRT